jgi:hypothetical protein
LAVTHRARGEGAPLGRVTEPGGLRRVRQKPQRHEAPVPLDDHEVRRPRLRYGDEGLGREISVAGDRPRDVQGVVVGRQMLSEELVGDALQVPREPRVPRVEPK